MHRFHDTRAYKYVYIVYIVTYIIPGDLYMVCQKKMGDRGR